METIPHTGSRPVDIALLSISLLLLYSLITIFHNTLLHPLRSIPGPSLAKLSKLSSRYGNLQGRKSHRIHASEQSFAWPPIELSFADPAAIRDIYSNDAFVKEEAFYRAKRVFHAEMLMSFLDPEAHKQRKKLLRRGFSQASMLAFEPQLDGKIETVLDQWSNRAKAADGKVDVYPWLLWLAFDIVCRFLSDLSQRAARGIGIG